MKLENKVKKAFMRRNLLRIKKHIMKFVVRQPPLSIMSGNKWIGQVIPLSVWRKSAKPSRSKYQPHQGAQEMARRV